MALCGGKSEKGSFWMLKSLDKCVRNGIFRMLAIGCVVFAVYGNTLALPFIYDDSGNILQNERIHSFSPPWRPLITEPGKGVSGRPVAALSFAFNYALSGADTWSYHLVNILIHGAVAVVLCNLILLALSDRRFGGRFVNAAPWLAFLSALLWCAHPLTTQAVTYISQRLESQAALFFLLCIYCALKGQRAAKPKRWYVLALAAYVFGAGTKESVGVAPLLIFSYDYIIRGKRPLEAVAGAKLLYGGLAAAMVLHGAHILYGGQLDAGVNVTTIPLAHYIVTQGQVVLHYFRLVFWPCPLVLDYAWPPAVPPQGLGTFLPVLLLAGATVFWACRRKPWSYPLLWVLLTLAPTCIAPMVDPAVEYRMYVPLMGVVFLVLFAGYQGILLLKQRVRGGWPSAAGVFTALLLATVLGAVSAQRNTDYQDSLTIWQDTINKRPGNPRGYLNYGVTLQNSGQYAEAFDYFLRSIEIEPQSVKAYLYAGISLIKQGHPEEAFPFLEQAKQAKNLEQQARAYEVSAQAYGQTGRPEAAVDELRKAVAIEPGSARLRFLLGKLYLDVGNESQALRQFCEAGAVSGKWRKVAPYLQKLGNGSDDPCAEALLSR